MDSELAVKLLSIPQRENAGARSSNRFTYQQVWAFDYMLKVMDSNKEFILFMEFHDDIIILDRTSNPELVEFYQIKTDDKESRYMTPSFIVKNANKYPQKMSIAQKLIDDYVKFEESTKGIHLVSNKSFDFGILKDKTESKARSTVALNEIEKENLKKIKNGMCQACNKQGICKEECLSFIYFDVSELDLSSYEDTVMGRMVKKMEVLGVPSTLAKTRSIYNTILGEIRRINNTEKVSYNVDELMQKKSISKEQFWKWINQLKIDMPDDLWNRIEILLVADKFTALEIRRIHKEWKKYRIESMNVEALGLQKLSVEASEIIDNYESEYQNSKDLIEHVYNEISLKPEARIYNKDYLYALIIKELFS